MKHMAYPQDYATVLKDLIQLTNMKLLYIAKALGYDISYISKWCNNSNLPSRKNLDCVMSQLSSIFAAEIVTQDLTDRFNTIFHQSGELAPQVYEEVERAVKNLLYAGYQTSKMLAEGKANKKTNQQGLLLGETQIFTSISDNLSQIIEKSDTDIELILTLDICKILKWRGIDKITSYQAQSGQIRIFAALGMNMAEFELEPDANMKRIYHFLNIKLNCEITIYENKLVDKFNVLAVRNHIAYIFSVNADGVMAVAAVIQDVGEVNAVYDQVSKRLREQDVLIKPENALNLEKGGYRTKFYSADRFCFYSCHGFEYLLPPDIVEQISQKAIVYSGESRMGDFVRRLQITWEEVFVNGSINFFAPKSNVIRYVEKGSIFYLDVPFVLSVEQRRRHVRHIVQSMKKNPKILLTVLDDDSFYYPEDYYNLSIYYNYNKAFFKKNGHALTNGSNLFYVILNEKLLQHIGIFFDHLAQEPYCLGYSAKDIEELIHKYEKMLLRMLDL